MISCSVSRHSRADARHVATTEIQKVSCSPFVSSEHEVKMTAPLDVWTKDKQQAIVRFLC
jgi:hypothetical protein